MLLYFVFVVLDVKGTKRKILKDKGVHSIHSNLERVPLFSRNNWAQSKVEFNMLDFVVLWYQIMCVYRIYLDKRMGS